MKECPVCYSQINDHAIKCPKCMSYIKPRINEGQFWGTGMMLCGIMAGAASYIWYLSNFNQTTILLMRGGIILAYIGFMIYGLGTFLSWFNKRGEQTEIEKISVSEGMKRCCFCGEEIDNRAVRCNYCLSYQRHEKGKILATFIVVSGILILTTAYIMFLAKNIASEFYMQAGLTIMSLGVIAFLLIVVRNRYSSLRP
jgi:hypothetical protein